MQRFQVPQFIAVEDKIIGNVLTAKQFIYIAAGIGLIIFIFFTFAGFLALLLSFFIAAIAATLAWGKIGGIPAPTVIRNAVLFLIRPRVFVWKRSQASSLIGEKTSAPQDAATTTISSSPKLSRSRLSELSWTLDTKTHDELKRAF